MLLALYGGNMKRLLGLKLAVIAVFTANAPARFDLHAESSLSTCAENITNVIVGFLISAQEQLDQIVDTCLLKVEQTKDKPFSYYVDQIIDTILKNWDYFVKKIGSAHKLNEAVEEFKKLKTEKNAISVGKKLAKYCEFLSPHSAVYKMIQKAKSDSKERNKLLALLKARLAIPG